MEVGGFTFSFIVAMNTFHKSMQCSTVVQFLGLQVAVLPSMVFASMTGGHVVLVSQFLGVGCSVLINDDYMSAWGPSLGSYLFACMGR